MPQSPLLAEKWLLLCHHEHKARFILDDVSLSASLVGAVIMDLIIEGALSTEGKNVVISGDTNHIPEVHGEVMRRMQKTKKTKSLNYWISSLNNSKVPWKRKMVSHLASQGKLQTEQRRFLFIPYRATRLTQRVEREQLKTRLKQLIFQKGTPTEEDAYLLSLLHASNSFSIVADTPKERRQARRLTKALLEDTTWALHVNMAVNQEVQTAIAASIVIAVTVVS
ncbi:MAG: GPP34 family phosphoprotein [Bacteroidota bacterium]